MTVQFTAKNSASGRSARDVRARIREIQRRLSRYHELDYLARKAACATTPGRRGLFWRRLMRLESADPSWVITVRDTLSDLIDDGSLAGLTPGDLAPCFTSADDELRVLALQALAMIRAA